MKLSANLSLLYPGLPLGERIRAAASDGFTGVEIQSAYELPADVLAAHLREAGTSLVLVNTPAGEAGEPGLAALPGRQADFERGLQRAFAVCAATGCPRIHLMAGRLPAGTEAAQARETLLGNLRRAAPRAAERGVVLTLEALNRHDVPGYFYHRPREAAQIVQTLADPAVGLQFDFYHCQREGLDLDAELAAVLPWVRHVQFAHAVGRHEPDPAEPAVAAALRRLAASGYEGWLGAEYLPAGDTTAGLGWRAELERVLAA